MKKIFAAGMLALCVIAVSQQQASAWINARFGVGLNWEWQSGGNNVLWGAWQGGQPGAPDMAPMPLFNPQLHHHHGNNFQAMPQYYAPQTYGQAAFEPMQPTYSPYHFATNQGPVYYYPAPYYYGR